MFLMLHDSAGINIVFTLGREKSRAAFTCPPLHGSNPEKLQAHLEELKFLRHSNCVLSTEAWSCITEVSRGHFPKNILFPGDVLG